MLFAVFFRRSFFPARLRRSLRLGATLFKNNEVVVFSRRNILDGENLEIDASQTAVVLNKNTFFTRIAVSFGFLKCSTQFQMEDGLYHPQQVQARITGNGIKEWACLSYK